MIRRLALTVICTLCTTCIVNAQEQQIKNDSLFSKILNEQRHLHIVFPKDYNPAKENKYEVVYLLDDIADFLTIEWNVLQWEGFLPKNMIMVGITNPKKGGVDMRDRDFTPTKTSDNSGGAATFKQFIKEELMPYIHDKYKGATNGNVLYGGSLGGLFVMYTLLTEPSLFTSYVAIDPSLWWDNFLLNKTAIAKFDSVKTYYNTLFIGGREGDAYRYMGVGGMDSVLKRHAPKGLDWHCQLYTNETHYSTNVKGFWEGLKFSYGGFYASTGGYNTSRKIAIKPKTGKVLKNVPFPLTCYNLMADQYLHYTTDGSAPTQASPILAGEETHITLSTDARVIVKSIGTRSEYDRSDTAIFTTGDAYPPIAAPKHVERGGLRYAYYAGTWDTVPKTVRIKPVQKGIAGQGFDVNQFKTDKDYVCILKGYLKIDKKGYYILEMGGGNQRSKVYLNNEQILGNRFIPGEGEMYLAPLEAGYYPWRIEYLHKKGEDNLAPVYIKPEGVEDFMIPVEMYYHEVKQ